MQTRVPCLEVSRMACPAVPKCSQQCGFPLRTGPAAVQPFQFIIGFRREFVPLASPPRFRSITVVTDCPGARMTFFPLPR
jgi:hypothetical protein